MYLRIANNFFKLLSLDRQVNEQTQRVVIFLYLQRCLSLNLILTRLQAGKGRARRAYAREYILHFILRCAMHTYR